MSIEGIAERIALKIKEANPEETASVDVMKFALIGLLHNGITLSAAFIVGLVLGKFPEVILCAISFMFLRLVSGGYHFKSALVCFFFSVTVFVAIPFIPVTGIAVFYVTFASVVLCGIFAPSNIRAHIRVSEKYFFVFKLLSVVLVLFNFWFQNTIISLAFLAQSLTLLTRGGGEQS